MRLWHAVTGILRADGQWCVNHSTQRLASPLCWLGFKSGSLRHRMERAKLAVDERRQFSEPFVEGRFRHGEIACDVYLGRL
jgi:hypothetical protein